MKVDLICTEANAAVHVTGVLTAEMVGAELACTFDTAWDGLVKLAWCRCGETKLPVALDAEGRGLIPHECMIGGQLLEVGADGWSEDGTLRIPTVWAKCGTVRQSAAGDIEVVPTPGMAVQILGIAQNADKKAAEALKIAETAADDAHKYALAADKSAADAKNSEKAANTAASRAASSAELAAAKEKEAAKSADDAGVAFGAAVTASKDAIAANAAAQAAKDTAVEAAGRAEQAAIDANTNIDELYDWTADRVAPEASAPRADQVLRDNGERIVLSSGYPGFSVYGYRVEEYTGRRISIDADSGGYLHAWTDNMSTISGHIIGEAHDGDRIPENAIRLFVTAYTDNPPVVAVLTNGIEKLAEKQSELERDQKTLKEELNKKVGYSEVVNGKLLMYSDDTKEHLLATLDLPSGGGVTDVQVAGESVVQDGVAKIPTARTSVYGLVTSTGGGSGIAIGSTGSMTVSKAPNNAIDSRTDNYRPVVPSNLVYAVDSVLCSSAENEQLTAEQQAAARQRMGIITLTQEEYNLIDTPDASTIYIIVEE